MTGCIALPKNVVFHQDYNAQVDYFYQGTKYFSQVPSSIGGLSKTRDKLDVMTYTCAYEPGL